LTVKTNPANNGVDLELPANLPLGTLIPGVIESLNLAVGLPTAHWDRIAKIELVFQVKQGTMPFVRLSDESTLEQAGVFDGAILLVEPGTQPLFSDIKCRSPKESMPSLQDIASCKVFVCRQSRNLIGRDKQQDNPIDIDLKPLIPSASMVSRKHASVYLNKSKQWFIRDEGSSNGTLLNGRLLSKERPELLNNGSQIQFGRLGPVLIFHLPEK
jgi:hypothetical protein